MKPKVGDVVYVQTYKHDGSIHRTWSSATVLDVDASKIVAITYKTWVVESNNRKWFTREPAILFYYFDRWYNVMAMIRKRGIYYYCNLASPIIYDGEAIKNIDYDLDVKMYPDGNIVLLDEDEFSRHQNQMHYPKDIIHIVETEKDRLMNVAMAKEYPFKDKVINGYFEKYLNLDNEAE
ncbi:MAG: DUF402 domain-containing protein [Erysipelothrix sp.]|nr:DUF402 domain-containing protein [Erysipelothrix sp.]